MGPIKLKTRLEGQIAMKPCIHYRGHILLKDGQNVCLDDISDDFENESC